MDSAGTPYLKNTCTFDGLNRTTRVNQQGQTGGSTVAEKRVDFSYNARGQFTSIARYKAVAGGTSNEVATSSFNYDTLERLTELAHKKGGSILFTLYSWTFDALSRVTGVTSCRKLATHAALCDCTRHNQARQGREIAGSVALRRVQSPHPRLLSQEIPGSSGGPRSTSTHPTQALGIRSCENGMSRAICFPPTMKTSYQPTPFPVPRSPYPVPRTPFPVPRNP